VDAFLGPYRWLVAYLLALAGFAALYTWGIPGHFHCYTAADEPQAQAELRGLSLGIEACAGGQLGEGAPWSAATEWMSETGHVSDLDIRPDAVRFRFTASRRMRPHGKEEIVVDVRVSLKGKAERLGEPGHGAVLREAEIAGASRLEWRDGVPSQKPLQGRASDWLRRRPLNAPAGTVWFALPDEVNAALERYIQTEGVSTEPTDVYCRMLYLSAATITTLGYGDIVPVSKWARLAVGLEAVLGVFIIGAFLAQLFQSPRPPQPRG
jgi:hypothetical protein